MFIFVSVLNITVSLCHYFSHVSGSYSVTTNFLLPHSYS